MSKIVKSIGSGLKSLFKSPKPPKIPAPKVPAPPAPTRREDTGAQIALGAASSSKNQRVSGRGGGGSRNTLSRLGKGSGINI